MGFWKGEGGCLEGNRWVFGREKVGVRKGKCEFLERRRLVFVPEEVGA